MTRSREKQVSDDFLDLLVGHFFESLGFEVAHTCKFRAAEIWPFVGACKPRLRMLILMKFEGRIYRF